MRRLLLGLMLVIGLGSGQAQAAPLKVVASFSILGDLAQVVGGPDVQVKALVGADGDAHVFQPSVEDAKQVASADVLLANGLGFDPWFNKLAESTGAKARLVTVSADVKPRAGEEESGIDPHAWQDVSNTRTYVRHIAAAFSALRPDKAAAFQARAAAYDAELVALDKETRAAFAALPESKRKIITGHDAFGYFGAAYGVTFLAPQGISTESEPTAAGLVHLIQQIKTEKVRTVFLENKMNPKLIQQLARDTGAKLGGTLYPDALSEPTGPASTYLKLFRYNVKLMETAMKANG